MFLQSFKADSGDRSPYGEFWFTPIGARGGGMQVTPDRALMLPIVLACVRVLSESLAVLPLKVYRRTGSGRKRLANHWLLDLFARPNQIQDGFAWREMLQGHLALRGNAYCVIQSDRSGAITALIPLHPDRVQIECIGTGSDFDYRYRFTDRNGAVTVYARTEIWHLRGLSSDGIIGLSPIDLARESVGLGLAAQEYGSRFFQNDAKPGGGWIEFPGNFKDNAARATFRETWQSAHSGLNRGKTAVLEMGMKYHEVGLTNVESQFLEARQFQIGDIARIYRIPPHKVGDLSKATFANIEQQSLEFVVDTMTPWAVRWESSIKCNLLLQDEQDIEPEFDFAGLLRGDQAARGAFYQSGIMAGWKTRNDARMSEGEEPLPGLDKPLMPLNMATVDENGDTEQSEPPETDAVEQAEPPEPTPANKAGARLAAMLRDGASRMARRIAAGKIPSPEVLAAALAITSERAKEWLIVGMQVGRSEDEVTASLILLGANE